MCCAAVTEHAAGRRRCTSSRAGRGARHPTSPRRTREQPPEHPSTSGTSSTRSRRRTRPAWAATTARPGSRTPRCASASSSLDVSRSRLGGRTRCCAPPARACSRAAGRTVRRGPRESTPKPVGGDDHGPGAAGCSAQDCSTVRPCARAVRSTSSYAAEPMPRPQRREQFDQPERDLRAVLEGKFDADAADRAAVDGRPATGSEARSSSGW